MKQHLVILCNNLDEAKNAAITLPNYKDITKFYVFNFDVGASPNLNWMDSNDDYLSLGKASELGNSAEICIRAGILYIYNWWHLIFCYANDLPSISEINNIKNTLDLNKGFIQETKAWGISKEHLLLFGLGTILGSGIIHNQEEQLKNELDIVKALRGESSSYEAIKEAFIEIVNIEGMVLQGKMANYETKAKDFINYMIDKFNIIPEEPGVIFVSPEISAHGFDMLINQISPRTMIVIVDEEDKTYHKQEYKKFNCEDKFYIKLFTKGGN
jgi:hypothetical protein